MKIFHLALSISSIFASDLREGTRTVWTVVVKSKSSDTMHMKNPLKMFDLDAKTEQRKVSEFMQKQIYGEGILAFQLNRLTREITHFVAN